MRTTLTLDDDMATELQRLGDERGIPFEKLANETLRHGLNRLRVSRRGRKPFRTPTGDLGSSLIGKIFSVAEAIEKGA